MAAHCQSQGPRRTQAPRRWRHGSSRSIFGTVKLREFVNLLGIKARPRQFGFVVEAHDLPGEGRVKVARWLHPNCPSPAPTQADVDRLRRFLRPGDVAIDVGAHVGDSTLPIALAVGPTGCVLALEPNRYVFPVLERTASLNRDKTSIVPLMFAAMRTDGTYEFQYGDASYSNGGFHEGVSKWVHGSAFVLQVEGRNLQDFLRRHHAERLPRLRFIKVDAEGFDLAVLETLEETIRERRPYLQVEMFNLRKSPRGDRARLFEFLERHGYAVYRVDPGQPGWGERITADNLARWNHYDVFCVPADAAGRGPP